MRQKSLLLLPFVLIACQRGPDRSQLRASGEFFVQYGGLSLVRSNIGGDRPCLRPLILGKSLLGGFVGTSERLVDFVERHKLARVERDLRGFGQDTVTVTPTPASATLWEGSGNTKQYCFGQLKVLRVEPVADAQPITAGTDLPYIVPGTPAQATRITYRLEGSPDPAFVKDLQANASVLAAGSMAPDTFGQEHSAVAVLPLKPDGYTFKPKETNP